MPGWRIILPRRNAAAIATSAAGRSARVFEGRQGTRSADKDIWPGRTMPPWQHRDGTGGGLITNEVLPRCQTSASGNRQAKGTHIGKQNGPTWGQMYTARGQSVGHRFATLLLFLAGASCYGLPAERNGSGLCGDATRQG